MESQEEKLGESSIPHTKEKKNRRISLAVAKKDSSSSQDDELSIRQEMRKNSQTQSRLTLARDSIILQISSAERKSMQYMSKIADEKSRGSISGREKSPEASDEEEDLETRQETKEEAEMKSDSSEQSLEQKDASSTKHASRLLLANDSYELIKKSNIGLVSSRLSDTACNGEEKKTPNLFKIKTGAPNASGKSPNLHKHMPQRTTRKKTATASSSSPRPALKAMGSQKNKEQEKPINEFTDERIKSLVDDMKENPSLLRLFTPCSK